MDTEESVWNVDVELESVVRSVHGKLLLLFGWAS